MTFDGTAIRQWLGFLGRGFESLQKLDSLYSTDEEDDLEVNQGTEDTDSEDENRLQNCYKVDNCDCKTERLKKTVKTTFCEGETEFAVHRHGMKEGFYSVRDMDDVLIKVGKYSMGRREGKQWSRLEGASWIITSGSRSSVCTGSGSTDPGSGSSVFIYPDLRTALVGEISVDGMATGKLEVADIVGVEAKSGILTPVLRSRGMVIPAPAGCMTDTVLLQSLISDPYESTVVEVRESLIPGAGEGLFTREPILAGQLVAYFAGIQVSSNKTEDNDYSICLDRGEGLDTSTVNIGQVIDIPQRIRSTYCGTLGHKACHSFQPSAVYSYAVHPRFGRIRSLVALHNLEKGVEITTDYKYQLSKAPTWYYEALGSYLVSTMNVPPCDVDDHIQNILHKQMKQKQMQQICSLAL